MNKAGWQGYKLGVLEWPAAGCGRFVVVERGYFVVVERRRSGYFPLTLGFHADARDDPAPVPGFGSREAALQAAYDFAVFAL